MRLTELHSSRVADIIEQALRDHRSYHSCVCENCGEETADDDEIFCSDIRVADLPVADVAKKILMELTKLEARLVPA